MYTSYPEGRFDILDQYGGAGEARAQTEDDYILPALHDLVDCSDPQAASQRSRFLPGIPKTSYHLVGTILEDLRDQLSANIFMRLAEFRESCIAMQVASPHVGSLSKFATREAACLTARLLCRNQSLQLLGKLLTHQSLLHTTCRWAQRAGRYRFLSHCPPAELHRLVSRPDGVL